MGKAKSRLYKVFIRYSKSFLFARPVSRIFRHFIMEVLMRQHYEFGLRNVFLVFNRSIGALLVNGPEYSVYCLRYEKKPVKVFKCLLKKLKRGIFIDVGAYVGFYTALAAKHGWRVVCFEPNPLSLILLRYNINLHKLGSRVRIVGKATGDEHGYALLTIAPNPSWSSITKCLRNGTKLLNVVVEIETIDSVVNSLGVSSDVNLLLKVDVEGFGLNVLKGAMKTIRELKPFILFEVHRTFDEEDEIHALRILRDIGYGFVVLEPRSKENFVVYAYPRERGCLCCEQT